MNVNLEALSDIFFASCSNSEVGYEGIHWIKNLFWGMHQECSLLCGHCGNLDTVVKDTLLCDHFYGEYRVKGNIEIDSFILQVLQQRT